MHYIFGVNKVLRYEYTLLKTASYNSVFFYHNITVKPSLTKIFVRAFCAISLLILSVSTLVSFFSWHVCTGTV